MSKPSCFAVSSADVYKRQILENAVEGCQKVSEGQRIIQLNLHSKGNFLFIKCENSYNEDNLRITNGKYKSSKKNSDRHGYGLKIINGIAEKYNGILLSLIHI